MQFQQILKADGARKILDVLDPIVAVAGKDGSFILNFSPSSVSCTVKDESSVMMCMMEADMTGSEYSPSCISPLEIPARPIVEALKAVGDEEEVVIGVTASGQVLVATESRRRVFNSLKAGNVPKAIPFSPEVEVNLTKDQFSRLAGLERIGETVYMYVNSGSLRIMTAGDTETDEIIIPTMAVSDAKTAVGATYLTDIVKRIRADIAELGFSNNSLFRLAFSTGCARFNVLIAPRVESE